ncbi:carbohydrate kinase family protein [Candidatus Beckwithbacteria bacterium]|nr:carbohydrate kinase family protein [Candidatus Beckwithbacteria bacterium]
MKFNVLCFGSATIDIYLTSADFKIYKKEEGPMLCTEYGGKINLDDNLMTTGGGATNVAVCFERLGLQTGLIACVGRDYWASIVRAKLRDEGVSLVHLQATAKKPTSSSIVLVGQDGGRTILVHRAASNLLSWYKVDWDRLDADWIYASSLGGDFKLLAKMIGLSKNKQIKIAFNPGGSELEDRKTLLSFLPFIHILILNKQEFLDLLGKDGNEEFKQKDVLKLGCEMVLITEGRKGSRVFTQDKKIYFQDIVKAKTVEETGAGDSFGSSFVAGQILGFSIADSLKIAAYNAASVVSKVGPKQGLLFLPEIKKLLS